jgi:hypothetical protein
VVSNPKYNLDAIEHCRTTVSTLTGPAAAAGDGLPKDVPSSVFGELDNSGAMASALNGLTAKAIGEYEKAKSVLEGVDRALDAILTTVKNVEDGNAQNLAGN